MMHHCSDETLLSHLDAELDAEIDQAVKNHLGTCWSCRNRLALLEKQIHKLVEVSERGMFPGPTWRNAAEVNLRARMAEHRVAASSRSVDKQSWAKLSLPSLRTAAWITSLVFGALVVGGILLLIPPRIEAKATLLRSVAAERRALTNVRAQRRTWNLEQYTAGRMVTRRKVEHWQGANATPAALRVYDEHQTLVAGEWISKNGSRSRYSKGHTPVAASSNDPAASVPRDMDEAGLFKLSTQQFLDLVGDDPQAEIHKDHGSFIVEFAARPAAPDSSRPRLLKATLVLAEDGLRPTSGVLVVNSAREPVEYRLQETGLERYVNESPPAHVFDRENIEAGSAPLVASMVSRSVHSVAAPLPDMPASANPSLEVRIIQQLALENLTLGEQVRLERKPDATLELHVLVFSRDKRSRLEESLATLLAEGGWNVSFTIGSEEQQTSIPGADLWILRQWATSRLTSNGATPAAESVERLTQGELVLLANMVQRIRDHAIAVREIGGRFRQADLDRLSEEEYDGWKTAVFQHIQALQTEAILLQRELAAVSNSEAMEEAPISFNGTVTVLSVAQDVERIHRTMTDMFRGSASRGSGFDQIRELRRSIQSCLMRLKALAPAFEPR